MLNRIRYLSWGLSYAFQTKVLGREIPFIGGLVLNESCNLHCKQCRVSNRAIPDLSFAEACAGLDRFRDLGIRSVAITGGEPFHWKDGDNTLEDVVRAARAKGFLAVTVYTNGTYLIESSADTIMVGLDGGRDTTRRLRSDVYDTVMSNIRTSRHSNIHINFSINALNQQEIPTILRTIAEEENVGGVFFYFHTPYYGKDALYLPQDRRKELARELLKLKSQGLPVLNSTGALNAYLQDRWQRPSKVCYTFAYNKLYPCCREHANPNACEECGYLGYLEVIQICRLAPSAIKEGFNYIPSKR